MLQIPELVLKKCSLKTGKMYSECLFSIGAFPRRLESVSRKQYNIYSISVQTQILFDKAQLGKRMWASASLFPKKSLSRRKHRQRSF